MLKLILSIPILGFFINNLIPSSFNKSRVIYMGTSIFSFYIILILLLLFNDNNNEFQYRESIFDFSIGLDGINLTLITLMSFI